MDKFINSGDFYDFVLQAYRWIDVHLLSLAAIEQLLIVAAVLMAAMVLGNRLSGKVPASTKRWCDRNLVFVSSRFHLPAREMFVMGLASLFMGLAVTFATALKAEHGILSGAATLVVAWALIRITSSIITGVFWASFVAVTLWIIAALNISGLLGPVTDVLNNAAIPMGTHRLSLLLVIKGALLFTLLLWCAGIISEGLERALWRSRNLTPSQKVLFSKLARIAFLALAMVIGLNGVGIDLTALAVFSGALGIGIGFGLQKVFGNLVSGFILLMDKSIKPGDVITIADTYGWVNRLGARYVSILTRDGKEHLIPNETLITERVENWSYSNNKVRIHIPVTVAYRSDIHLVKRLLLEAAGAQTRILSEPKPVCLLSAFGESGILFELRVWIEDPINGVANIRSAVNEAVWDAFKANGVDLPYPQRDVHLRLTEIKDDILAVIREANRAT